MTFRKESGNVTRDRANFPLKVVAWQDNRCRQSNIGKCKKLNERANALDAATPIRARGMRHFKRMGGGCMQRKLNWMADLAKLVKAIAELINSLKG